MLEPTELKLAVLPIPASEKALRRFDLFLALVGWFGRLVLHRHISRFEITGAEHLKGQSKLILMNHSSPLDPVLLTFYGRQSFQFLVTEPYMIDRKFSRFLAWMGQIPKRKLDPDTRAIRTMKQWCQIGGKVATFPEGQFSWDGYPLPLQPGLGELVKYLGVPVVTARLINGDRLWPAWARKPRKTSLRLEIDPPKLFQAQESIEDYVAARLRVDPETCARFPVSGKNLASGLDDFLRFCFSCASDGSLTSVQDQLRCSKCGGIWTVDGENRLRLKDSQELLTVAQAWARVRENLLKSWSHSKAFCKSRGKVQLIDASRSRWVELEEGDLILKDSGLSLGSWNLNLRDLRAHTMDWGNLILLRTERKRFALRFAQDSRAVWTFALDQEMTANAAV